jgi:hypothetical protein
MTSRRDLVTEREVVPARTRIGFPSLCQWSGVVRRLVSARAGRVRGGFQVGRDTRGQAG